MSSAVWHAQTTTAAAGDAAATAAAGTTCYHRHLAATAATSPSYYSTTLPHHFTTAATAALERTRSNAPAELVHDVGRTATVSSSSMPPLLLSSYLRMAVWRGCNEGVLEGGESRPPIEHAGALFHQWVTCDGWMARVTERRRGFIRVVICPQTDGALLGAGSSSSSSLHASNAVMQLAQPEQPVCARRPRRPPFFAQLVVGGRSCQKFWVNAFCGSHSVGYFACP